MACARYERERNDKTRQEKGPWNAKTRLCRRFCDDGHCPWGESCTFAHGPDELRVWGDWDPEQWKDEVRSRGPRAHAGRRALPHRAISRYGCALLTGRAPRPSRATPAGRCARRGHPVHPKRDLPSARSRTRGSRLPLSGARAVCAECPCHSSRIVTGLLPTGSRYRRRMAALLGRLARCQLLLSARSAPSSSLPPALVAFQLRSASSPVKASVRQQSRDPGSSLVGACVSEAEDV